MQAQTQRPTQEMERFSFPCACKMTNTRLYFTSVNQGNANASANAKANAINGKVFISLRLYMHLPLYFTRVNRGNANANANANARWKILVPCLYGLSSNQNGLFHSDFWWNTCRERYEVSGFLRWKLRWIQRKTETNNLHGLMWLKKWDQKTVCCTIRKLNTFMISLQTQ